MVLKAYTRCVKGIIGAGFKLTFKQRIRILFCKKLDVLFIEGVPKRKERRRP